jgi:transposase
MIAMREVRDIYNQGVWAVADAFRRLYEMIEVKDEQVQKLIALATAAHLKKIEGLDTRILHLEEELLKRKRQIHRQQLTVAELDGQIARLRHGVKDLNRQLKGAREQTRLAREAHLASVMKDSQNSSRPPSSDRHKRTRSLRERSGRRPGGQAGHPGATLELVGQPDHLIVHAAKECRLCGSSLKGGEVVKCERRQVYDLPPLKIEVTEHRARTIICHYCGVKNKAKFPSGVNAPAQYGERIESVAAYLLGYQLLPYDRCAETIRDLFDCPLSVGTLTTLLKRCAREMVEPLMLIKEGLRKSDVLGVGETNLRVNEKQQWIHVTSSNRLTLLAHHRKRGRPAIESVGILPRYEGVCVHDGFTAYDRYDNCRHSLCNAHLLRELNYVIETTDPGWAKRMKTLLLEIKAAVDCARGQERFSIPARRRQEFQSRFDAIIEEARKLYGALQKKHRNRRRRSIIPDSPLRTAGRKLARRMEAKKEQVLRFMQDFSVPFDNNQSERDLRMIKVKQKISGCFRTERGAEDFCNLRSYVSTMRKQGHRAMEAIRSVIAGKAMMPHLRC